MFHLKLTVFVAIVTEDNKSAEREGGGGEIIKEKKIFKFKINFETKYFPQKRFETKLMLLCVQSRESARFCF